MLTTTPEQKSLFLQDKDFVFICHLKETEPDKYGNYELHIDYLTDQSKFSIQGRNMWEEYPEIIEKHNISEKLTMDVIANRIEQEFHTETGICKELPQIRERYAEWVDKFKLTKAQEEYFKDSKLRDRNGNLVPCYHFTNNTFDSFDLGRIGESSGDYGYCGKGIYFTSMTGWGKSFGHNKLECYINMEKPLIVEELDNWQKDNLLTYIINNHPDYGPDFEFEYEDYNYDTEEYEIIESKYIIENLTSDKFHHGLWSDFSEQITEWAKKNGYDGILSESSANCAIREVVVFEPNQIKSIDNLYPTKSDNFRDNSREYFKQQEKPKTLDALLNDAKNRKEQKTNSNNRTERNTERER